jgi:hypothetical protein
MGIREVNTTARAYVDALNHSTAILLRAEKKKWPADKREAAYQSAVDQATEALKSLRRAMNTVDWRKHSLR